MEVEWTHFVVAFISFFLGGGWHAYTSEKARTKYKWECPVDGCSFTISSPNDPGIIVSVAADHTERSTHDG